MGRPPRRPLNILGSSTDLLGEATLNSRTLDISGPRERRLLEPHSVLPVFVISRSTRSVRLSPKLSSPLCLCSPQPAAAEAAALPSPTSCVRPVWLWPPVCIYRV